MSGRAGIELTPTVVRLVRLAPLTGGISQTVELPWDPARPLDAVNALRAKVGALQEIALTIGLGFLEVARLELPPVPAVERTRIVELEPDRYFAAANREALAVAVAPDEPIAFAAPAALVRSWLSAFETWAPVEWVESAPVSLARALGTQSNGTYAIEATGDEVGLLQIGRGRLTSVRRTLEKGAAADARPVPSLNSLPAQFAAAYGVARSGSPTDHVALAPDEWRRKLTSRRRATLLIHTLTAVAALVFAVWAADRWRERTLNALESQVAEAEARGASADTALRMLRSRESEAHIIADIAANRPDPHAALAAISAALPREATVLSARANGNDWQVDGTTTDASTLVPLLDRQARFDSVRFLSASSRYRDANRSYETFSVALRFRP
jgi:Tfp pilus assembly protein PilN